MKKNIESIWQECESFRIQQKKQEFLTMLEYIEQALPEKKNCFEVGAYDGGTTVGFLNLFDSVVTVDIEPRPTWAFIKENYPDWISLKANTHNPILLRYTRNLNRQYDFIFIDGDHSAEGVEMDFLIYKQFLKPGGIIGFHDIIMSRFHEANNCYVHEFWQRYKSQYEHLEIIYNGSDYAGEFASKCSNQDWGGVGLLLNVNPMIT
jgi:predicted O-methyltransferase YrrM